MEYEGIYNKHNFYYSWGVDDSNSDNLILCDSLK